MPYTTFYAKKSYIVNNSEIINSFNKAINRGLKFVFENDSQTIAEVIKKQFVDTSLEDLEKIIDRYKSADTWFHNTSIKEEYFNNLQDLLIDNKLIESYVNFSDLVVDLNE